MRSGQRSKAFVLATTPVQLQKWVEVEFIKLIVEIVDCHRLVSVRRVLTAYLD